MTGGGPEAAGHPRGERQDAGAPDGAERSDASGRVDESERRARAVLTRVTDPGDEVTGRWLERYDPREAVRALRTDGPPPEGMSEERWAGMRARAAGAPHPEADLAAVRSVGGRFVIPGDPEWPGQLDDLGAARPLGLWVRGAPGLRLCVLRSVALVGARACTDYGAHVASLLGATLAERGWTVVSGAAYGIDGAAHRGALAAGGTTVGVLACGVDRSYPPGHRSLIRRIAEQGLVVAELPPGEHPTRSRFVLRNRVIAALTRGTVVVEAALRSGSLATARQARRLGRFVMGTPGPVTSQLSAGVHELLRGEGVVVTDADEVIELVGAMGELAPVRRGAEVPRDALPLEMAGVLEAVPAREPVRPADVARAAGTTSDRALARLVELRALGFVERRGDEWRLTRPAHRNPNE